MSVNLSLEFFPPKTPEGVEKLRAVRQKLYALKPEFCSVTFGAGGSTQDGTLDTVREIVNLGDLDPEAVATPGIFVRRVVEIPAAARNVPVPGAAA